MYRLHHQQYIPSTYFDTSGAASSAWQRALSLFDPAGPLADAIKAYEAEYNCTGPSSTATLLKSLDTMRALLHFPWDNTDYAPFLEVMLTKAANANKIRIGTRTESFAVWLAQIGVWEREERGLAYPIEFQKVAPPRVYRYTFVFDTDVSFSVSAKWYVSGACAIFSCKITVESGVREADGSISTWVAPSVGRDGVSQITCRGALYEGDFGHGSPGLPSEAVFYSAFTLTPQDFDGAVIWVRALDAEALLGIKISTPVGSASAGFNSKQASYWLTVFTKDTQLDATCDVSKTLEWETRNTLDFKHIKFDLNTLKNVMRGDLSSIVKIPTSWKDLVSYTLALGVARGKLSVSTVTNWNLPGAPRTSSATMITDAELQTYAMFEFDKFSLDRPEALWPSGWRPRLLLEIILASEIAIFAGLPRIVFAGYASPEGHIFHNQGLSEKRANAVCQAVADAFGTPLDLVRVSVTGFGESGSYDGTATAQDPSNSGHPTDPPEKTGELLAWEEKHQELVRRWPQWRRVDVIVRGTFALRVETVDALDGDGEVR
jgi:hypothetical protein